MKQILLIVLVIVVGTLDQARGASATANATQTVIASLTLVKTQDLAFGVGVQGDSSKTILATDLLAASFTAQGEPNHTYTITLPTSITMTTGTGTSPTQQIVVNTFTSNPSLTGTLSATGAQILRVGATRSALLVNQITGSYTAPFTVVVVY